MRKSRDVSGDGGNKDRHGGLGSSHLQATLDCWVLSQNFYHSLALGPASESSMKLQAGRLHEPLFLCTWPVCLGDSQPLVRQTLPGKVWAVGMEDHGIGLV